MTQHQIFIKGMVCDRCILSLKQEFHKNGIEVTNVYLGEATVLTADSEPDMTQIEKQLHALGFSLVQDKNAAIIKKVKELVAEVYSGSYDFPQHFKFSKLVEDSIGKEYESISTLFSATEKITIEKYAINYRLQKVKEYLVYTNLSLADIAFKLNFSSVAHLSRQFKILTGLNASYFREIKLQKDTHSTIEN